MKKIIICIMLIIVLTPVGCGKNNIDSSIDMTPRLISSTQTLTTSEIVENVKSAIVGISCALNGGTSIGSGVAIASGGYILTNQHVVSGANSITVHFANQDTAKASLVWSDSSLDIAVIKSKKDLPYLDYSPLEDVAVGEDVLAIGTPISLQFQHTVTKGIVSALNRTLEIKSLGGYTTYMQNLIQHDASINSGNSGGPLINSMGRVIGINSLKASDAEGIGFAIPIETAVAVMENLTPNGEFNQVKLGIFACDASVAKGKQLTELNSGVYVLDVQKESLAAAKGVAPGQVITNINGKEIRNMLDFRRAIYALHPGDDVQFLVPSACGDSASPHPAEGNDSLHLISAQVFCFRKIPCAGR